MTCGGVAQVMGPSIQEPNKSIKNEAAPGHPLKDAAGSRAHPRRFLQPKQDAPEPWQHTAN